jgi:uncharacterized CHY-type Zn-finger protein
MTTPPPEENPPLDHLGLPISPSPKRNRQIPEDDGMRQLRTLIHAINARDIPSAEKARLMHEALLLGYRASKVASQPIDSHDDLTPAIPNAEGAVPNGPLETLRYWQNQLGEALAPEKFDLTESDIAPTYAPIRQTKSTTEELTPQDVEIDDVVDPASPPLGCQHYERNVKLQCFTCKKWYTCRFCHDAHEDHALVRKETKNMLCMLCATPQRASDVCINCGEITAQYYCDVCKLWENRQSKPIYHCVDCGICRRGLGLGKDFFHCKARLPGTPSPHNSG